MNSKFYYIFLVVSLVMSSIQDVYSQVIKSETRIIIGADGRKSTQRTFLIHINDKQSNWLSHIEIMHNPMQDFSFNFARIIDPYGNILKKIRKKDLTTRNHLSYQAFYQDDLITEFDLYWNQYPYRIEYSYTLTEEEFLNVAWWTPFLYLNVPTIESSLEVNVPLDYSMHTNQSGEFDYIESTTEDRRILYWKSNIVRKRKDEIYSFPIQELIPTVLIVPSNFKYGVSGSFDSWALLGIYLNNLNEGMDQLPLDEKVNIERLITGISDKKEIIKKIYYYLQDETRYINVAIDVGGLKSYPASYVCQNKYGDCKALTTYMKSMLKSAGIDSHYTFIKAGENKERINADFPSQQFNHVILAIPLENDTIWLENTSNSLPFNYLGTFTQNRDALMVKGANSGLVRTPKLQPKDVLDQRDFLLTVDEKNIWQGEVMLTLRGNSFEEFRHTILNQDKSDQEDKINKQVHFDGFNIDYSDIIDYQRDSTSIKILVQGNLPSPIRKIGNWEVINPLKILIPDFDEPGDRNLDVRINYPISKSDRIVYKIRNLENKKVEMPEGIIVESIYGQYSAEYIMKDNSIVVHENFTLLDNDISINKYSEFYSFIKSIIDYKKKSAILLK